MLPKICNFFVWGVSRNAPIIDDLYISILPLQNSRVDYQLPKFLEDNKIVFSFHFLSPQKNWEKVSWCKTWNVANLVLGALSLLPFGCTQFLVFWVATQFVGSSSPVTRGETNGNHVGFHLVSHLLRVFSKVFFCWNLKSLEVLMVMIPWASLKFEGRVFWSSAETWNVGFMILYYLNFFSEMWELQFFWSSSETWHVGFVIPQIFELLLKKNCELEFSDHQKLDMLLQFELCFSEMWAWVFIDDYKLEILVFFVFCI